MSSSRWAGKWDQTGWDFGVWGFAGQWDRLQYFWFQRIGSGAIGGLWRWMREMREMRLRWMREKGTSCQLLRTALLYLICTYWTAMAPE